MFNQNDSINIGTLLKLCKPGIVAFINEFDKKVWVTSTNSTLDCIATNTILLNQQFHKIKELNEDVQKLEVVVLEQHKSSRYLKYKVNYCYNNYIALGYTAYEEDCKAFEYRFHEVIDHTVGIALPISLYIAGKSRSLQSMLLVGKFKTMVELEEFKNRGIEECLKEIDS